VAMGRIERLLDSFDNDTRARITNWLWAKYGEPWPS
jgi:hypothetical protein